MQTQIFLKKIGLTGCPYTDTEKFRLKSSTVGGAAYIWLTDDAETLKKLKKCGECCVYLLTPENRDVFCPEAEWCVESGIMEELSLESFVMENLSMEFLWRVWLRCHDLPWQICETDRLYLREMTEEDLDFLYFCQQDPISARFTAGPKAGREEELEKIRAYRRLIYGFYGFGLWIVCEKETGRPVGRAGLQLRDEFEVPELGFEIEASSRRQGYAMEVLKAVIRYSKEELELDELRSVVDAENTVSGKICEALGFTVQEHRMLEGHNWIFYEKKL